MSELIRNNASFSLTHGFQILIHSLPCYFVVKMKCHSIPGARGKSILLPQGQGAKRGTGAQNPLQDHTRCPKDVLPGCTSEMLYYFSIQPL